MSEAEHFFRYLDDGVSFQSEKAADIRELYFPLCGVDGKSAKSSITPYLSGDIKVDRDRYITRPVSRQDLRFPLRNFFLYIDKSRTVALTDRGEHMETAVRIGQLWHQLTVRDLNNGLEIEALNFVPADGEPVELMRVVVRNKSDSLRVVTPTGCIPIFARSLANKHDHEHVTSLLNRVEQLPEGILVFPTMRFNEQGHYENHDQYFVFGIEGNGVLPAGSFPTVESFLGREGTFERPRAVYENMPPRMMDPVQIQGKEIAGALRFDAVEIAPGESRDYYILIGAAENEQQARQFFSRYQNASHFEAAFEKVRKYWDSRSTAVMCRTADSAFDSWMRWVAIQPVLRRIFGCSFLPDHDYGKGGRGWRDLWQDLLSLILIEPEHVRGALINNFAGVRIDGSNATIIGDKPGEFSADRNAITRVWMDHGAWPVMTTLMYIEQSGDSDILFERQKYFRDPQQSRSRYKDENWQASDGNVLKTSAGKAYLGTVLEHMLVQTLVQFFNVGEHNMIRLESADWNDGLDMAFERGESVAFSAFYAGNLMALADMLEYLKMFSGLPSVTVLKELEILFDLDGQAEEWEDHSAKQKRLDHYFSAVQPDISGEVSEVGIETLSADLRRKGHWLIERIRFQEWITAEEDGQMFGWFNGYYDNQGRRVEGQSEGDIRMTLTGQVFALMAGAAGPEHARGIISSADHFLREPRHGGHRLNTDFGVRNDLDLGRAFSFAYGTKENGAVFSHMTVMYAYALYRRGFAREGYTVIQALYHLAMDSEHSGIYPNLPEYFDSQGKGMYCYLTGSASWLVLTMLTQSFGMRGDKGDLCLEPKLVSEQFDDGGCAAAESYFAGRRIIVSYHNADRLDYDRYRIGAVRVGERSLPEKHIDCRRALVPRGELSATSGPLAVRVELVGK
ncbi:MAG: GH36-type glycosyl hydrolase domain-containing protein [Candidatus Omnitrophota bacterium]